jgi:tetratricopeptide (TPR) repeat protein
MKNEHRHKLSQNSLARILENRINDIKGHSATISRLVLVLLIAVLILMIWRNFDAGNKRGFYTDIKQLAAFDMTAFDAEQFDSVIKDYVKRYPSGANNANVSLLIGNIYFNYAADSLAKGERDKAVADYETALQYYTTADKFGFKQQDLAEGAVWGLAQTNEVLATLKEGDFFDVAKDSYQKLCTTWPDGKYYELATRQLDWLNRPVAGTFPTQYRQSDPALFAPNMQTPEITSPVGEIDTTITPGDFDTQSLLDLGKDSEMPDFDPGLVLPEEPVEPQTQEMVQESN